MCVGVLGVQKEAERIGIFELVRFGRPERRTTQAWACSPNKGAKPLHSDWQAVRKASVLTKHVTSRKWSEDSLYFFTGSHTPLMFLPRLASKSQSVFLFHLILTSSLEPRQMIEPLSTTDIYQPHQPLWNTILLYFSCKNIYIETTNIQRFSPSRTMICLPKAEFGLCVLVLPGCLLLGPSNGILYETLEQKRHSFGPESFCC